jgi:hypothetical protein
VTTVRTIGEHPTRHAGRVSAFGGRIVKPVNTLAPRSIAWCCGGHPTRHAGRASAFGGRIK